jgi:hypothetical protein
MDHSKRVSVKENVDAFKSWNGARRNELVVWRQSGPVRRRIRRWNVFFVLATAGLLLSTAGLLFLIGVGQVQISAAGGGSKDLFGNWWVISGCVFAVAGLLWGAAAVSAISSQAAALNEFPDLAIRVVARSGADVREPGDAPYGGQPIRLFYVRMYVVSRERRRTAVLSPTLLWPLLESERSAQPWAPSGWGLSPARWVPNSFPGLPSISALTLPLHIDPGAAVEGDLFFEIAISQAAKLDPGKAPTLFLSDDRAGVGFEVSMSSGSPQGPSVA